MQLLLTFAVVFLGYNLISSQFNKKPDPRSSAEILQQMQNASHFLKDATIAHTHFPAFEGKLKEELEAKSITKQDHDTRLFHGRLLVAYTQYKGADRLADFNRIIPAHDALSHLKQEYSDKPVWTQQFPVDSTPNYQRSSLSFDELSKLVESKSEALGRTTPVWGFFPGYQLIDFLVRITGSVPALSYAFACLVLAFLVRLIVFPLAQKTFMHSRQMSQLTPLINEIREEYKSKGKDTKDITVQNEMNQRIMGLYKEYGLNPMAGCFPAFLQMPLFLLIYQSMLHYRFEFQKGTFFWINPGAHEATNGFIAANLGQKDYILIFLYGVSMVATTLLTPVSDPSNAKQQRLMGVGMSVLFSIMMFFWPVPSAFPLYWIFTNIFATAQSQWTYRRPLPPLQKVNASTGGMFPKGPSSGNGYIPPSPNGKKQSTGVPKRHKPKKKK